MALAFTACQKDNTEPDNKINETQLTQQQIQQVALMKEASLAIGKTIKNSETRNYLVTLVRVKNDNSEAISMAALLGDQANITKYEKDLLAKGFKQRNKSALDKSFFAKALLNTVYDHPAKFPLLSRNLPHEKSSASTIDELNALRKELASQNLEIYLPYEKEFDWNKITKVTVTWHPLVRDTWSKGEIMSVDNLKSAEAQPVGYIDENYVSTEPTVLVRPIDPADYTMIDNGDDGGTGGGTGGFEPTTRWVTTNLDYTKVSEKDVLSVYLPKLRLLQNYRGWLGGSSQITIYRVSGDIKTNSTGDLIPSSSKFRLIYDMKISRDDVKDSVWYSVNIIWDDDWDLHENTEQFVLVSRQGLFSGSKLEIKGSVKIGYDFIKQVATANATVSANFDITTERRCKLRYNNQLSRRGALANVVGDIGAGTIFDNGVYYTIRTADALQYYFKYKWTDVAE
jgi:hypothetical protein